MDYIIVRHKQSNEPPPARRSTFLDATLVVNARTDSHALKAVSEQKPKENVSCWDIVPVFEPVDASVTELL